MVALTLDAALDSGLAVVVAAVVIAVLLAWFVKAVVAKLMALVVIGALVAVVWSQRVGVEDCAGRVRATLAAGAVDDTTCTFFGQDVTVPAPLD